MEYKLLGKPIVSTQAAAKEQITDGINGLLCETDASALADRIETLLKDTSLLQRLYDASAKESFEKQNADAVKQIEMLI